MAVSVYMRYIYIYIYALIILVLVDGKFHLLHPPPSHRQHSTVIKMGSSQSTPAASNMYTATAASDVYAAQATALTLHPTSNVEGKSFNRFVQIFLENQDYAIAEGDANIQSLVSQGIKLDNYWSVTHPSQPNYVAALGADTNGVLLDSFWQIDDDVETMIDLLEAGGISWSIYGEDMPFSGFEADWVNQETGANMYVRKHNPMMSYNSATGDIDRLAKSKNMTMFYDELANGTLPQWIWITPNMSKSICPLPPPPPSSTQSYITC